MTTIDATLFARVTLLGFAAGVGALYGLTVRFKTERYRRRYKFKESATRRDKFRTWAGYMRRTFVGKPRETVKYTLAWGVGGASLFGFVTLVIAGIGAVFL